MLPKVSVVTCSFNRAELLQAAIESMRAQTDQDWEHLIYDDASTDRDVIDVLEWARHDPRVRVWRGHDNLDRPSVLWNFMLDRAHGRYLTVLDDDNEKLPTFVEAMSAWLDADPMLDVVTCGWRVDRANGTPEENYFLNMSTSAERLQNISTCDGGAMLYRRSIFERAGYFSEALRTNEDWDWLRRAVHIGKVKNLHEIHSTYRSHNDSRMKRATALGNDADVVNIKARPLAQTFYIDITMPPENRLTASQRDVCQGVKSGLTTLAGVRQRVAGEQPPDLHVVVSPFQLGALEIAGRMTGAPRVLSIHMEDPYALGANIDRVQRMKQLAETWVCTNDAAAVPYYRKVVGDRVIVCPLLSTDAALPVSKQTQDVDILLCGYAYPSRQRFVRALLPLLSGFSILLVGDGWENFQREGVTTLPTQPLAETYAIHARARTVICAHRVFGDCSDGVTAPASINRGFMEGFHGPRIFLDRTRPYHALDEDDVIFYNGPGDLAGGLRRYLANTWQPKHHADVFQAKCKLLYTYRARLARILNCVRAPRFLAEIP